MYIHVSDDPRALTAARVRVYARQAAAEAKATLQQQRNQHALALRQRSLEVRRLRGGRRRVAALELCVGGGGTLAITRGARLAAGIT